MFENIGRSIQESAEGWRMAGAYVFGGRTGLSAQLGGVSDAPIKAGDVRAGSKSKAYELRMDPAVRYAGIAVEYDERDPSGRYAAIKAAPVGVQVPGTPAPVGVRYIPSDPGTPATVVETIQRKIGKSAEGWRMGFAHVADKAKEAVGGAQKGIEKSLAGWGMGISHVGGKVSESFGNIGGGLSSFKYPIYAILAIFLFIAVMISVGYSGVGGPAARVAEKEYARRR